MSFRFVRELCDVDATGALSVVRFMRTLRSYVVLARDFGVAVSKEIHLGNEINNEKNYSINTVLHH